MAGNGRQEGVSEEKRAELKAKRQGMKNANSASPTSSTPAASASAAAVTLQKPKRYRIKKTKRVRKYIQEWITLLRKEEWVGEYEHRKMLKSLVTQRRALGRLRLLVMMDGRRQTNILLIDRLVEDEILVDVGSYEVDEEVEEVEEFEDENGS